MDQSAVEGLFSKTQISKRADEGKRKAGCLGCSGYHTCSYRHVHCACPDRQACYLFVCAPGLAVLRVSGRRRYSFNLDHGAAAFWSDRVPDRTDTSCIERKVQ